jgi:alpha-tubulin suppressor-like RCC1 family protein
LANEATLEQANPTPIKLDDTLKVSDTVWPHIVTGGGGHTIIVLRCKNRSGQEDEVYDIALACGWNQYGQLGIGHREVLKSPCLQRMMWEHISLEHIHVASVSCGWNHTLFALTDGRVFVCGSNDYGQLGLSMNYRHVDTLTELTFFQLHQLKIVKVAAGLRHSLALTADGDLYAWGEGKFGQLGLAEEHPFRHTPKMSVYIPESTTPKGLKFKDISAGQRHSLILTCEGRMMATGSNKFGQLGFNPHHLVASYEWLEIQQDSTMKWCQVYSGWTHNLAIDIEGNVWSWGRNHVGQLGMKCHENYKSRPTKLMGLNHVKQVRGRDRRS